VIEAFRLGDWFFAVLSQMMYLAAFRKNATGALHQSAGGIQ
jgi:hypothetical protein